MKKICFVLLILFSFFSQLYAQENSPGVCGDKFDEINKKCISNNYLDLINKKQNVKNIPEEKRTAEDNRSVYRPFILPIKSDVTKIVGQTYFLKTASGKLGKFIIRSAIRTGKNCDVNVDVVIYHPKRISTPNGSFRIKRLYGKWTTDKTGFDENTTEDLILTTYKGLCVFKSGTATVVPYKQLFKEDLIKGRDLLAQAGLFLIFLAVFLVARAVFQDEDRYKAQSMLEEAEKEDGVKEQSSDLILKYSRPFFKRYFTPVVQGMKNKKKIRERYKRKLATSGLGKLLSPEDMYAFKLFLIIGFPILFLGLREFLEESWPLAAVPIISMIGFKYPDIWLNGKIAKRKEEVVNAMPFIVDMLALAVEAGLDFMAAIQKVVEKAPPSALSEEFEILIKETRIGASRAEGLRQLAWRTDSIEISSFTATLIAADSVGASIGPILKTLAAEMRQKRSAEAEKKGATAATKILFPMMFLIMPAVAIVIMAPVGLQMMAGG